MDGPGLVPILAHGGENSGGDALEPLVSGGFSSMACTLRHKPQFGTSNADNEAIPRTEETMSGWEPERSAESWSDTEAWRGEVHLDGDESWRSETVAAWEDEEASSDSEEDDNADLSCEDWPENLAGPEYWLYKRDGM
jgi:hypothetical protein